MSTILNWELLFFMFRLSHLQIDFKIDLHFHKELLQQLFLIVKIFHLSHTCCYTRDLVPRGRDESVSTAISTSSKIVPSDLCGMVRPKGRQYGEYPVMKGWQYFKTELIFEYDLSSSFSYLLLIYLACLSWFFYSSVVSNKCTLGEVVTF